MVGMKVRRRLINIAGFGCQIQPEIKCRIIFRCRDLVFTGNVIDFFGNGKVRDRIRIDGIVISDTGSILRRCETNAVVHPVLYDIAQIVYGCRSVNVNIVHADSCIYIRIDTAFHNPVIEKYCPCWECIYREFNCHYVVRIQDEDIVICLSGDIH